MHVDRPSLFVLFCAASFLLGLTQPLFFELGAALTYPANEGVSAGLVSGMLNAAGLVLCVSDSFVLKLPLSHGCFACRLAVLAYIPPDWQSVLMTATVLVCALMVVPVREQYLRSDYDEKNVGSA